MLILILYHMEKIRKFNFSLELVLFPDFEFGTSLGTSVAFEAIKI